MRDRRRRGGFLLVNLLMVLGLLAAFGFLAERVVRLSLHTLNKAEVEQDELIRMERAMHVLRADVWGARNVDVVDKNHVQIADVEWKCAVNGDVTRTEKGEEQRWAKLGLEFEWREGWLVVRRAGVEVAVFQRGEFLGGK